jgi:EAL domain-containing protein (putative c-di-GMP-specific phosphodiesterase class I)
VLEDIISKLQIQDETTSAHYADIALHSAFQPIISLAHHRTVGYEALLRGNLSTGEPVSPPDIFKEAKTEVDAIFLDRLCRTLHVNNFLHQERKDSWLFLNIKPEVMVNGVKYCAFFKELLEAMNLPPSRVVVEILEGYLLDEEKLDAAVSFYRDLGCLIAIDDFGAGHSNFQRIWRLKPHIVKLDRSIIHNASIDATARRMLPSIVDTLHEAGSLVLAECIENEQEAMIAMDAGTDLVQGYYFGRPNSVLSPKNGANEIVSSLFANFRKVIEAQKEKTNYPIQIAALTQIVKQLNNKPDNQDDNLAALESLLKLPAAESYYILDHHGVQLGGIHTSKSINPHNSKLFKPLSDSEGAVWIHRPYWHRAMLTREEVQCTRPYLSVATGQLCVTLSIAYQSKDVVRLLCLDLNWKIINA